MGYGAMTKLIGIYTNMTEVSFPLPSLCTWPAVYDRGRLFTEAVSPSCSTPLSMMDLQNGLSVIIANQSLHISG